MKNGDINNYLDMYSDSGQPQCSTGNTAVEQIMNRVKPNKFDSKSEITPNNYSDSVPYYPDH